MATDRILLLSALAVLIAAPVALFGVLCALNRMQVRVTRKRIATSYVLIAWGWGAVLAGVLDYLVHQPPIFWPSPLLAGVALLAIGNAALFLTNRRKNCLDCVQKARCL